MGCVRPGYPTGFQHSFRTDLFSAYLAGHMGHERVTVRNLDVIFIDTDRNLILVKGPVPGPNQGLLFITESRRLNKRKTRLAKKKS